MIYISTTVGGWLLTDPPTWVSVSQSEWNLPSHFMLWWKECRGAKGRWSEPRYNMSCYVRLDLKNMLLPSEMCWYVCPVSTLYCNDKFSAWYWRVYTPDNTCVSPTPAHPGHQSSDIHTNFLTPPSTTTSFPSQWSGPAYHQTGHLGTSSMVAGLGRLVKLEW